MRADPTFASWNGLRLWPLAAPLKMHVHVLRNTHWNQEQNENERTVRGPHPNRCRAPHRATHLAASRQGPSNSLRQMAWRAVRGESVPQVLEVAQRRAEESSAEERRAAQSKAKQSSAEQETPTRQRVK
jgi:hypothetical protein